jgi:mevalonate kinase
VPVSSPIGGSKSSGAGFGGEGMIEASNAVFWCNLWFEGLERGF